MTTLEAAALALGLTSPTSARRATTEPITAR